MFHVKFKLVLLNGIAVQPFATFILKSVICLHQISLYVQPDGADDLFTVAVGRAIGEVDQAMTHQTPVS